MVRHYINLDRCARKRRKHQRKTLNIRQHEKHAKCTKPILESTREAQFVNEFLVRGHLRQKMPIPRAVPKGA